MIAPDIFQCKYVDDKMPGHMQLYKRIAQVIDNTEACHSGLSHVASFVMVVVTCIETIEVASHQWWQEFSSLENINYFIQISL